MEIPLLFLMILIYLVLSYIISKKLVKVKSPSVATFGLLMFPVFTWCYVLGYSEWLRWLEKDSNGPKLDFGHADTQVVVAGLLVLLSGEVFWVTVIGVRIKQWWVRRAAVK